MILRIAPLSIARLTFSMAGKFEVEFMLSVPGEESLVSGLMTWLIF